MNKVLYVGLDVHADTIAVAVADEGRLGEIRYFGTISNTADSVLRLTKRLVEAGKVPTFCYEAGPCGYGLYRHLTKLGFECAVVAPAIIPRKAGDRVKTDLRVPRDDGHGFHAKVGSHSTGSWAGLTGNQTA